MKEIISKCKENSTTKTTEKFNHITHSITSESVNIGHPDKTCDYIADCFLDEALKQDKNSQMAVECAIKNDKLFIYGEATTNAQIDYDSIARKALKEIGYTNQFKIIKEISEQSNEINHAINQKEISANDQGIIFGYATNETKELMPLPITIAHKLMKRYEEYRKSNSLFKADAKCQVSVVYENNRPIYVDNILLSVSHDKEISRDEIVLLMQKNVIDKTLEEYSNFVTTQTKYIINPSGSFTIWGSFGDSGCVGRKIVVDTYGGIGRVGGGCFSSKNATKVDRSSAYYARYVAKNIVHYNLADKCEIEVSYAIGMAKPISLYIDCFGTNKVDMKDIYEFVENNFDFSVKNIIDELNLLSPIYSKTSCYGHFGNPEFSWEKIKKINVSHEISNN